MPLVIAALWVGLKKSAAPLLLLLAALALTGGAALLGQTAARPAPVRIAVVDEEQGAFSPLLLSVAQERLGALAELSFCSPGEPTGDCAAVLTLPQGFWQGMMSGENRSPVLTLSAASPLEGLWAAPLAHSAARTIEAAQRQIAGLLPALQQAGLPEEAVGDFVPRADMALLEHYLGREGRIAAVRLSATGAVTLGMYLLCCAATGLAGAAAFLFFEAFFALRRFARISGRLAPFGAAALLALLLSAAVWLPVTLRLGGLPDPAGLVPLCLGFAGMLLLVTSLPGRGACAAASVGLTLGQALLGGGLFPQALLPPALARIADWFPLTAQRHALAAASFGAGAPPGLLSFSAAVAAAALLASALLWFGGRGDAA